MQQWIYQSLRFTGNDLFIIQYATNVIYYETIKQDPIADNSLTNTLRRWIADLGLKGWELVGIITDDTGQELIFKQPYYDSN